MNTQETYQNFHELSPSYPQKLLDFLKFELKMGKKYLVLDIHEHSAQLSRLVMDDFRLVCSSSMNPEFHNFIKNKYANNNNFLSLNSNPAFLQLEDDSMDVIFLDSSFFAQNIQQMKKEFERVLRLNSYVLLIFNEPVFAENSFSHEFQRSLTFMYEYDTHFNSIHPLLKEFYKNSFQKKNFDHTTSYTKEELKLFFESVCSIKDVDTKANLLAGLMSSFDKYQSNGKVNVELNTTVYYGLFNYSVPDISLRKSIFFNILKPFAFGFYLLIKTNIYFWRFIYTIKERISRK